MKLIIGLLLGTIIGVTMMCIFVGGREWRV